MFLVLEVRSILLVSLRLRRDAAVPPTCLLV